MLIVWGREDDGFQTIAQVRERAALIPNARFELVPGGHEPWLEDLESTASRSHPSLKKKRTPRAAVSEGFDMVRP